MLLDMLVTTTDPERSYLPWKRDGSDHVVLLVNNLGGLSQLELDAAASKTVQALAAMDIRVERAFSGTYMVARLLHSEYFAH